MLVSQKNLVNGDSLTGLLTKQATIGMAVVFSFIFVASLLPSCILKSRDAVLGSFFNSLGLLMAQGSSSNEKSISQRILQITLLLFALMITNIVLGSLTSLLSSKVESIKIDSFKALVDNDFSLLYRVKSVFSEELGNPGDNRFMAQVKLKTELLSQEKASM